MNWSSVKNLLILMLFLANVFLVYSIGVQDRRRSYIDSDELADAAYLLAERGLNVYIDGIPLRRFESDIFESSYSSDDSYYEYAAKCLSGSERELIHLLDGAVRIISENGAATDFTKDFGFSYTAVANSDDDAYTEITADNFAEMSEKFDEVGLAAHKKLAELCDKFLGGSDESGLHAEIEASAYDPATGRSYILASQMLGETPVFRHKVLCVFEGETLAAASGRWYFGSVDTNYDCEPADQVNILFTDLTTLSAREKDDADAPLPAVEAMSPCYAIYMNTERTALYLIPAWQIDHSDGSVIVYNAAQSTQYFTSE